jgi:CRP-like cAMP-binding protein
MERILFLRRVPLFAELSPGDLKGVAAIASEQVFAAGELIARGGEVGAEMYVIVSGEVRVMSQGEAGPGREIVRRRAGEYVGEMSILNRTPRIASLVAVGEVRLLSIERTEFEEILRLRPDASLAVMRVLCNRLIECDNQVAASIH